MAYEPPSWSTVPPPGSYTLEIIRDGVVIETVDASTRAHYILGRDPSAAHVHLPHPSVSRQHAVIQHRDSGGVWLMDLGSTHGTTINKKACPSRAYVALPPGAMVRLGSGSRLVTLLGPPDEAGASKAPGVPQPPPVRTRPGEAQYSAARAAQRAERIAATTGRSAVSADDLHGGGAGWGFDADAETSRAPAEEAALDALELEQLLKMADAAGLPLSARGRVLQEQRSKRQTKAENLLLEVGRIAAKEVEGLSEGQASAKQRAEERAAELNEQVASLGEQLADIIREQLAAAKGLVDGGKSRRAAARAADNDEDDFFDRTAKKKRRVGGSAAAKGKGEGGGGGGGAEVLDEAAIEARLAELEADEVSAGPTPTLTKHSPCYLALRPVPPSFPPPRRWCRGRLSLIGIAGGALLATAACLVLLLQHCCTHARPRTRLANGLRTGVRAMLGGGGPAESAASRQSRSMRELNPAAIAAAAGRVANMAELTQGSPTRRPWGAAGPAPAEGGGQQKGRAAGEVALSPQASRAEQELRAELARARALLGIQPAPPATDSSSGA